MITLAAATAITKAKVATLQPGFADRVLAWYSDMVGAGVLPYIYEGLRSPERQDELYRQGRTSPGKVVTNARAGQSFHNYGLAFDWVPLIHSPKAADMYDADWGGEAAYRTGQRVAVLFKLRFLNWETPHLEDATYKDYHELAALV